MGLSNALTTAVGVILIIMIITVAIDMLVIMNRKLEMVKVMRYYVYKIETEGYLSNSEKNELIAALEALSIINLQLEIQGEKARFGDYITLNLDGVLVRNSILETLRAVPVHFDRKILSRRILN